MPLETCGFIAPQFKDSCVDIRLVELDWDPASIYGIIKEPTNKKTYVVPLLNFNSGNVALNYLDTLN